MDLERDSSMPSVGPVPPPPPIEDLEDCDSEVSYGKGVDTYTNNYMADDESVEAQHVVYTFAEEKSSKTGRKKWMILMCSIVALLATIIVLGAVYGAQRSSRNKSITEANAAKTGPKETEAAVDPTEALDGDVYITPGNATDVNATSTEEVTEPEVEFSETLEPTTWTMKSTVRSTMPWTRRTGSLHRQTATTAPTGYKPFIRLPCA